MVALSTCDAGKWSTLEEWVDQRLITKVDQHNSSFNYVTLGEEGQQKPETTNGILRLRQPQRRLTTEQVTHMCHKYQSGASIYELGEEFGIDRRTVSIRLKDAGMVMRHAPHHE